MIRCEHNKDGDYADEQDPSKPGEQCIERAAVIVAWEDGSQMVCTEHPEHLMLLTDALTASMEEFYVWQLVDITDAITDDTMVTVSAKRPTGQQTFDWVDGCLVS